jgi:hypothetical protein
MPALVVQKKSKAPVADVEIKIVVWTNEYPSMCQKEIARPICRPFIKFLILIGSPTPNSSFKLFVAAIGSPRLTREFLCASQQDGAYQPEEMGRTAHR